MAIIGISGYAGSGKDTVGHIIQWLSARKTHPNLTPESFEEFLEQHKGIDKALLYYETGGEMIYAPYVIKKWAGKLKSVANILTGLPMDKFEDQEFKKSNMSSEWSGWALFVTDYRYEEVKDMQMSSVFFTIEEARIAKEQYLKTSIRNSAQYIEANVYEVPMTVRDFLQKLGTEGLRNGLHTNTWVNALMSEYKRGDNWVITDTRFPNEAEAIKKKDGIIIRLEVPDLKPVNKHKSENALDCFRFDYTIFNTKETGYTPLIEKIEKIMVSENLI